MSGTDLYVGGAFTAAGSVLTSPIAKWNGTTWSRLGTGINDPVWSLAVNGSDIDAGGEFTATSGVAASRVAKWDGSTWSRLGTGLNNTVYAVAVQGTDMYAGGRFSTVGDGSKVSAYFDIYHSALVSGTATPVGAAPLSLYPNPAHRAAMLALPAVPLARAVLVHDALGRLVRQLLLPAYASSLTLDLTGLPVGVYNVRCGVATARLVIE